MYCIVGEHVDQFGQKLLRNVICRTSIITKKYRLCQRNPID